MKKTLLYILISSLFIVCLVMRSNGQLVKKYYPHCDSSYVKKKPAKVDSLTYYKELSQGFQLLLNKSDAKLRTTESDLKKAKEQLTTKNATIKKQAGDLQTANRNLTLNKKAYNEALNQLQLKTDTVNHVTAIVLGKGCVKRKLKCYLKL